MDRFSRRSNVQVEVSCDGCGSAIFLYPSQITRSRSGVFLCRKTCTKNTEKRNCVDCGRAFFCNSKDKRRSCGPKCPNRHCWAQCELCDSKFSYLAYVPAPRFCTKKCRAQWVSKLGKSMHYTCRSPKRLAAINEGEEISSLEVFETYNWTCHICRQEIDSSLRLPNKRAATIDHIIPLAKGGRHIWENVAPAHADCNFKKSDSLLDTAV